MCFIIQNRIGISVLILPLGILINGNIANAAVIAVCIIAVGLLFNCHHGSIFWSQIYGPQIQISFPIRVILVSSSCCIPGIRSSGTGGCVLFLRAAAKRIILWCICSCHIPSLTQIPDLIPGWTVLPHNRAFTGIGASIIPKTKRVRTGRWLLSHIHAILRSDIKLKGSRFLDIFTGIFISGSGFCCSRAWHIIRPGFRLTLLRSARFTLRSTLTGCCRCCGLTAGLSASCRSIYHNYSHNSCHNCC